MSLSPATPDVCGRHRTVAFGVAFAVLAVAAASMTYARMKGLLLLVKHAVPLRAPLSELKLPADSLIRPRLDPPLSSDIVHELGTSEYAGWTVEDSTVRSDSGVRHASVFITYYTGKADQVPHVPEECYTQGGMQSESDETMVVSLTTAKGPQSVKLRQLLFRSRASSYGRLIYYAFICNGDFYFDRIGVRARMVDPRERHLYYCKVELAFDVDTQRLPRRELEQAAQRLMNAFVPVLLRDHLPDWDAVKRQSAASSAPVP